MSLLELCQVAEKMGVGLGSIRAFNQACLKGLSTDPENGAFFRLFADLTERFIERYDREPLLDSDARKAHAELRELTRLAANVAASSADAKLRALNQIAKAELCQV